VTDGAQGSFADKGGCNVSSIFVYRPVGIPATTPKKLAPRLRDVRGVRLGVLDNCKEFADHVVGAVAEVLERDHGVREVTIWRKGYPAKPAPFLADMASKCDAVVNGVGH
jgi:hypothetical protein